MKYSGRQGTLSSSSSGFSYRCITGRKQSGTRQKEDPARFESFLVVLNMVSMHILPLLVIFTPFFDAYAFQVADPVRFIFFIIFAFNIWLFLKAHRDLGKNWSIILEIKDGHRLVTTGIYEKIRHPIYTHFWIWVITQELFLQTGLSSRSGSLHGVSSTSSGCQRGGNANRRVRGRIPGIYEKYRADSSQNSEFFLKSLFSDDRYPVVCDEIMYRS